MYRIGICHFRVGLMDGVSLEIDKWKTVLEEMGHKVYLLASETSSLDVTIIPELHLGHPETRKIYHNAFHSFKDFANYINNRLCDAKVLVALNVNIPNKVALIKNSIKQSMKVIKTSKELKNQL